MSVDYNLGEYQFETLDSIRGKYCESLTDITWREWFTPVTLETITRTDMYYVMYDLGDIGDEPIHETISDFLFDYLVKNTVPHTKETMERIVEYVNIGKKFSEDSTYLVDKPLMI